MRLGCGNEAATSAQFVVMISALSWMAGTSSGSRNITSRWSRRRANQFVVKCIASFWARRSVNCPRQPRQQPCDSFLIPLAPKLSSEGEGLGLEVLQCYNPHKSEGFCTIGVLQRCY